MSSNVVSSIKVSGAVRSFVALGIFLGCLVLFFFFVLLPEDRYLHNLKVQFEAEQNRLDSARTKFSDIPELKKRILELESRYSSLKERLPDSENIPEIIKQLSGEIGKFDIKLISLIPKTVKAAENEQANETTIDLTLQLSYRTLADYLEAIENLPLLFRIKDISIEEGIEDRLTVRLILATYNLR